MSEIIKATPDEAGCWLEGSRGHYAPAHAVMIAWERGMPHDADDELVIEAYRDNVKVTLSDGTVVKPHGPLYAGELDAGELISGQGGMCEVATAWLNDNVAPENHRFEWRDGEFFLSAPCEPSWVAGMMSVHPEDLETILATGRRVECDRCGESYHDHG